MLINLLFLVKKRDGSRENSKLTILLEKNGNGLPKSKSGESNMPLTL